jgi:predicted O-methyltransferase YrrM
VPRNILRRPDCPIWWRSGKETLSRTLTLVDAVDLLLLDGRKPLYLALLKQLEPALSPGCLILADDVISLAEKLPPYLAHVRDVSNGYVSCKIPLDDGLALSVRNTSMA